MLALTLVELLPTPSGSYKRYSSVNGSIALGRGPRGIANEVTSGLFRSQGTQVMSKHHAKVTWQGKKSATPQTMIKYPYLEDCDSTNGTSITRDGDPPFNLKPKSQYRLKAGDVITFGKQIVSISHTAAEAICEPISFKVSIDDTVSAPNILTTTDDAHSEELISSNLSRIAHRLEESPGDTNELSSSVHSNGSLSPNAEASTNDSEEVDEFGLIEMTQALHEHTCAPRVLSEATVEVWDDDQLVELEATDQVVELASTRLTRVASPELEFIDSTAPASRQAQRVVTEIDGPEPDATPIAIEPFKDELHRCPTPSFYSDPASPTDLVRPVISPYHSIEEGMYDTVSAEEVHEKDQCETSDSEVFEYEEAVSSDVEDYYSEEDKVEVEFADEFDEFDPFETHYPNTITSAGRSVVVEESQLEESQDDQSQSSPPVVPESVLDDEPKKVYPIFRKRTRDTMEHEEDGKKLSKLEAEISADARDDISVARQIQLGSHSVTPLIMVADFSTSTDGMYPLALVPTESTPIVTEQAPISNQPSLSLQESKRRRINYKHVVVSSTIGFFTGAVVVIAGLGALGASS